MSLFIGPHSLHLKLKLYISIQQITNMIYTEIQSRFIFEDT